MHDAGWGVENDCLAKEFVHRAQFPPMSLLPVYQSLRALAGSFKRLRGHRGGKTSLCDWEKPTPLVHVSIVTGCSGLSPADSPRERCGAEAPVRRDSGPATSSWGSTLVLRSHSFVPC